MSYSSIVPGTAVVRVQTRSMIFTSHSLHCGRAHAQQCNRCMLCSIVGSPIPTKYTVLLPTVKYHISLTLSELLQQLYQALY